MSELAGISFSGDILEGNSQNETREEHDEYSTIRLEAYELTEQAPTTNASEKETNASWTIYELSEPSKFRPSIVTSPKMSEIIAEDEMEPGYLASTASIQISVSNPKKSEETSKLGIRTTFTTYFVQSETSLADYPFTKRAVWRRYKDFDMLHRLLRENHRGYIIPPIPSKNFIESKRGKDAFIKERQMELNKFLCQVALHKHLYNTEEFKVFLGCPGDLNVSHEWCRLIEKAKQLMDASEGGSADLDKPVDTMKRDMANMFKKVSNTIRRDVMSQSYAVSETEKSLQDMVPKLKQYELSLNTCVEKAQSFATNFETVGSEMGLLGRIWLTISRFEEGFVETVGQYSPIGRSCIFATTALHKSGYAAVRVQQISAKSCALLKARLAALTDCLNIMPSILMSLHDRTIVLRHLHEGQDRLEASRRGLDNLKRESSKKLGGTSGYSNKSAVLSQDIQYFIDEVNRRTEMYDIVTKRNLEELERQRSERQQNLNEMVLSVAKLQQEYYETISLVWINLAEEISRMENPDFSLRN